MDMDIETLENVASAAFEVWLLVESMMFGWAELSLYRLEGERFVGEDSSAAAER